MLINIIVFVVLPSGEKVGHMCELQIHHFKIKMSVSSSLSQL
jgi:hypothetical protein